jgi:hypothetical protein
VAAQRHGTALRGEGEGRYDDGRVDQRKEGRTGIDPPEVL